MNPSLAPQSRLNMDPPPQDELRQTIKAIDALGRLEARYEEDNAYNGRYNNYRQDPHPRQDHKDNEDNSAKHIKVPLMV